MNTEAYEPPDLDHMSDDDLCRLLLVCGMSRDPSDKQFAKACRDELSRRKPSTKEQRAAIPSTGTP